MSLEAQLEKTNALLAELIRTLQQDVNPVVAPAQDLGGLHAPALAPAAPTMPAPSGIGPGQMQPPPAAPPPVQAPPAAAAPPPAAPPPVQAPPAAAAPPAQPDNVVQMPAAGGPALTREQLNGELMAVVAQLGGGQAAAQRVMQVMTDKYKAATLQAIDESQYPALLADVKALVGG